MEDKLNDDSKWSKACIRISGDNLQPDEVSRELGLQATKSGLKGERLSGRPRMRPLLSSLWMLNSPLSDQSPLEDHLKWLLDVLEPKFHVISRITKQHQAEFFCGFGSDNGQGGCIFAVELLERLVKLGVPLVLDLHPPGPIALDSE
jgi:hypothetical protein